MSLRKKAADSLRINDLYMAFSGPNEFIHALRLHEMYA